MATRLRPVAAHWRRIPDRPDAFLQVHLELGHAYLRDQQRMAEIEAELADEIDRTLQAQAAR